MGARDVEENRDNQERESNAFCFVITKPFRWGPQVRRAGARKTTTLNRSKVGCDSRPAISVCLVAKTCLTLHPDGKNVDRFCRRGIQDF
jgi:hypothetical protein